MVSRHLAVFTRFSLLARVPSGWRVARASDGADAYRAAVFARDRLELRLWTFGTLVLPSVERARQALAESGSTTAVSLHVLTSDELPAWAGADLDALVAGRPWVTIARLPPTSAYPGARARDVLTRYLQQRYEPLPAILATAGVDDDDIVAPDALVRIDRFLAPPYIGMSVSLSNGLVGMLDSERRVFTGFRALYSPKIAILATHIVQPAWPDETSSRARFSTCFDLGPHLEIDARVPVISDATGYAWIRTMHDANDVLEGIEGEHWTRFLPPIDTGALASCDIVRQLPLAEELQADGRPGDHPRGHDIMSASKMLASQRRDKALRARLETRHELTAALTYHREAQVALDDLRLDDRGRILEPDALMAVAASLSEGGHAQEAIAILESALAHLRPADRRPVRVRLFYLLRDAGDKKRAADYLTVAGGKGSRPIDRARRLLKKGKTQDGLDLARATLITLVDESTASVWIDALALLYGVEQHRSSGAVATATPSPPELRLWAVSGMGWSGSGAVYDFLRDMTGVRALRGESRLIEGKYGLVGLLKAIVAGEVDAFLPDMLAYTFMGAARCRTYNDYRHVRNARRGFAGAHQFEYANAVLTFLRWVKERSRFDTGEVVQALWPVLQAYVRSASGAAPGETVLLDNVVHVSNVRFAQHFRNVKFVAVVRDPRDQYVDNLDRNRNFKLTSEAFIERYDRQRRLLSEVAGRSDNVMVVDFERFVADVEVRRELSAWLGVRFAIRVPVNRHFIPEESAKNIGIHRDRDGAAADIALIERQLRPYLFTG
jgi:hypothetical protein